MEHPEVARSMNNLAALFDDQARYDEAEPLYKRALVIYEKTLGPEHPRAKLVRENLNRLREKREAEGRDTKTPRAQAERP